MEDCNEESYVQLGLVPDSVKMMHQDRKHGATKQHIKLSSLSSLCDQAIDKIIT